jgi:CBS domain-containing protein
LAKLGEKMSTEEVAAIIAQVDTSGTGEISFEDFKAGFEAKADAGDEAGKLLKRKFRSSIRMLILQGRIVAAFNSFDAQYNFLRFSDVAEICPPMTMTEVPEDMLVGDLVKLLTENGISCAPVTSGDGKPYGFVDMMDLSTHMINKTRELFRIQTEDPGSLQMRVGKVGDPAGQWFNTKVKEVVNLSGRNPWGPIRTGYAILDAAMILGKGTHRLPHIGMDGKVGSLLSQATMMKAFNDDPKNRLGKLARSTAEELGGRKDVLTISSTALLMKAFEAMNTKGVSCVAVIDDTEDLTLPEDEKKWTGVGDGRLVGYVSADSCKLVCPPAPALQLLSCRRQTGGGAAAGGLPVHATGTADLAGLQDLDGPELQGQGQGLWDLQAGRHDGGDGAAGGGGPPPQALDG